MGFDQKVTVGVSRKSLPGWLAREREREREKSITFLRRIIWAISDHFVLLIVSSLASYQIQTFRKWDNLTWNDLWRWSDLLSFCLSWTNSSHRSYSYIPLLRITQPSLCPRGHGVMDKAVACGGNDASDLGSIPVASKWFSNLSGIRW